MEYLIPEFITMRDGKVIPWAQFEKQVIRNSLYLVNKEDPREVIAVARLRTITKLADKQDEA